jgi:hypothetical protein
MGKRKHDQEPVDDWVIGADEAIWRVEQFYLFLEECGLTAIHDGWEAGKSGAEDRARDAAPDKLLSAWAEAVRK